MIARFNNTFNYNSYAFRWPNSGITQCVFKGNKLDIPLHEALGLKFDETKKVGKGKKRMHIFGLSQGAFLHNKPSKDKIIHLSDRYTLKWELESHITNNTNDGGGTCSKSALKKILTVSNVPFTKETIDKTDSVQLVIITSEYIVKGIFVIVDDHLTTSDLIVPEPSLVTELTSYKYTMGKVNTIMRKEDKRYVTFEPLQVVPNFLNFVDHNNVAEQIYDTSLKTEEDIYNKILTEKNITEYYEKIVDDKNLIPFAFEPDELHNVLNTKLADQIKAFIKASATAGNNSPFTNTVVMEQLLSGTYRHTLKLLKHWRGLPGIIISGGRHYITYAPHAAEIDPPPGYLGIIYWKDKCKECGSTICHNHFERDIRRISINPIDCTPKTRDLLDGFDMDDSCFWTLLQDINTDQLFAWIGRNPMSPDRGLILAIQPEDAKILLRRNYVPLPITGLWKNPDLWQIEETLKLGELRNIPKWTWDDIEDLKTCFDLSSKTGGLGQLALYTSAFQYSGQWDVNRHHILNSNVVDAQVNADADLEWTVQLMHRDFINTFIQQKKPISKYIADRMEKMFIATGIDRNALVYGNSPKLDALTTSLEKTSNALYKRDELRKLLANGTASRLTMEFKPELVSEVLSLAKQIRHLWTNHFSTIREYDLAVSVGEIDEEVYDTYITKARDKITNIVEELITTTYNNVAQWTDYNVGEFAATWMQIQASKASRFRLFEDQQFTRPISTTPLINLPIEEILTCFYSPYTQPTWISRLVGPTDFLIPGSVYTVEQDQTGLIYLLDGDKNIAATLLPESAPIVGETVQYIDKIPRHHEWIEGSTENWDPREDCAVFYVNHTMWMKRE